jgi:hypothetical protein
MTLSLARLGLMGGVESGKLQHIETKTASNTSAFDFTSLGSHKAHLLTLDDFQCSTTTTRYIYMRVSTDGGSSFETGSNYSRSWQRVQTNGSNVNEIRSLTETSMTNFGSIDSNDSVLSSKIYIYNITSATARTAVTFQSWNPVGSYMYYGMFMVNLTEAHNAFRIFPSGDAFATGRAKLYGISS